MNQDDPKPGVVIDVQPEPDDGASDTPADGDAVAPADDGAPPAAAKSGRSGVLAIVLALLALLAVAAAGVFAYRYWTDVNAELAALDARIGEAAGQQQALQRRVTEATAALASQAGALDEQRDVLSQQRLAVDEAKQAFVQQEQRLADENLRLQEREAELRAAVADVHRRVGRSGTQWIIAEVDYLLRIANHRLILARDTGTAQVALELADQRLRDTQDPGWAGVRAQIARDIAKLAAFEAPDSAGMAARLAAAIEQIPQLKIARATIGPERTLPERVAREPGERSWDTLLDDLWSGFKDAVRIRERDQPVQAMLPPEQQFFLYENLKLQLEAARLGIARGDQALFRDNLGTASEWLATYFEPGDGTTAALRDTLDTLLGVELEPELPDLSQSLRALRVRRQLLDDVAPGGDPLPATEGGTGTQ